MKEGQWITAKLALEKTGFLHLAKSKTQINKIKGPDQLCSNC